MVGQTAQGISQPALDIGPMLLIFLAALVVSVLATPVARRLAHRYNVVDAPSSRKIHADPVPLLGGAAIYLSVIVSLLSLLFFGHLEFVQQTASILVGATLMSMLGAWDDKRAMRPLTKLAGQVLAASLLYFSGVQIGFLRNEVLNYIATVGWVVAVTNALNLMDNMDGLAGGVAAVASLFFFLIATLTNQYLVAPLAAVLVGACVGFLYYNFHPFNPVTIFMGDTGSLFLGYMLAAVGIKLRFPDNYDIVTWMVPVLVLGVPLFDTALVTLSRIRRGIPISRGGKDHFSHRLVALGLTKREAVLVLYLVQGALGAAALVVMQADLIEGYLVGLFVLGVAVVAAYKLEQVDLSQANPAPPGSVTRASPFARLTRRKNLNGLPEVSSSTEQEPVRHP